MIKFVSFDEAFGDARWIAPQNTDICPIIRRDFELGDIESAEIDIIGFSTFVFYVNGVRGCEDYFLPLATDYEWRDSPKDEVTEHRTYVSHYDITHLVRCGRNTLAVMLGDGWYTGKTGIYEEVPYGTKKLCFKITIKTKEKEYFIYSDESAVWRESYVKESDLNYGETHDYAHYCDALLTEKIGDGWKPVCTAKEPKTNYAYTDCPPDRIIEVIEPRVVSRGGDVTLYDAGKNLTGFPTITVDGYDGRLEVYYSEDLDESGALLERSKHRQKTIYTVHGERRTLEPAFTWLGFRYFTVKGEVKSVTVKRISCDIPVSSHFECDNKTLGWLYHAYVLTELSNMHQGIPSDCPHIERRGYLGDGHLTCRSAMLTLDAKKFYEKWIGDISDSQDRISGHAQYTAPYTHSGGGPGGFSHGFIKIPYEYYLRYGDDAPIRKMYGQFLAYLGYLEEHSVGELVVSDKEGEWCLGEWCTPREEVTGDLLSTSDARPGATFIPPAYVNTVYHVKSLELMKRIAEVIGNKKDIPLFEERIERKKTAIKAAYYNPNNGNFIGNMQGANSFALDIGLGDDRTRRAFIAYYEKYPYYDTGIFGTETVTRLLFEYGRADIAYKLLTAEEPRGFGDWRKMGATTLWEYWKSPRSRSHPMFGSPTAYLFEYILGIRHAEGDAGYERVVVAPALNTPLACASGFIGLRRGRLAVSYEKAGGAVALEVSLPDGVEADILLGEKRITVKGGTHVLKESIG